MKSIAYLTETNGLHKQRFEGGVLCPTSVVSTTSEFGLCLYVMNVRKLWTK